METPMDFRDSFTPPSSALIVIGRHQANQGGLPILSGPTSLGDPAVGK